MHLTVKHIKQTTQRYQKTCDRLLYNTQSYTHMNSVTSRSAAMTRQTTRAVRSGCITSAEPQDVVLYVNESVRLEVMNREVARRTAVLLP